jgi:hypothetical protein
MPQLTIDNWLAVGGIAVAILAPVGQVLFQRSLERADRARNTRSSLRERPQFLPAWKRQSIRAILYLLPTGALAVELMSSSNLSRLSVLTICICVASLFTMYLSQRLTGVMGRMLLLQEDHLEVTSSLLSVTKQPSQTIPVRDTPTYQSKASRRSRNK